MRIIGCHYAGTTLKAGRSKNADVPQIFALNLSCIMLKNGQTYLRCSTLFDNFPQLCIKELMS